MFRIAPAPSKGSRRSQSVYPLGVGDRAEAIGDFGGGRDAVRGHCHSAHKAMKRECEVEGLRRSTGRSVSRGKYYNLLHKGADGAVGRAREREGCEITVTGV